MARREPKWLSRAHVEAIHAVQMDQHGGLSGMRDVAALESALGRPRHQWHYDAAPDVAACAAAYGSGIARNHAFSDGNKRTAFQTMFVFMALNGMDLVAAESETVTTMLGVAEGTIDEVTLATWLRNNSKRQRRKQADECA